MVMASDCSDVLKATVNILKGVCKPDAGYV